jgi:secretion/DNA translocation related TadE-like protein
VVLVCSLAVLAAALVQAVSARHRAATAADLAALSAVSSALAGEATACAAAARVAVANNSRLIRCGLADDVVELWVEVELPGWLRHLGPAFGRARAGPGLADGDPRSDPGAVRP